MGILATPQVLPIHSNHHHPLILNHQEIIRSNNSENSNSMSQDYHHHQGIFSAFSNGSFERSAVTHHQDQQQQQQQQHIAQQIRRDKLRLHGFEPPPVPPPPLVGIEEEESSGLPVYDGMLSEMFNFAPGGGAASSTELLDPSSYRSPRQPTAAATAGGGEWYGNNRQGMGNLLGDNSKNHNDRNSLPPQHHHHHHHHQQQHHQISSINADSAAAMQLFLMNPQPRSPSPTPPPSTSSSTLHMLLPNPSTTFNGPPFGTNNTVIPPPQFTWVPDHHTSSGHDNNTSHEIGGGIVESQGLSLSLSSLQHLEAAKAEEFRIGDGGLLYFNQGGGGGSSSSSAAAQYHYKNLVSLHQQQPLHLQAGPGHQNQHQIRVGYGSSSSLGTVNTLRNSKYVKAAQDLLEEFCSVGRGQFKKNKFSRQNTINPSSNPGSSNGGGGGGGGGSSSSTKDLPPLSASDRIEHQRRKVKLLSMLDEVERRYNHYCEQMQMVVNSFDVVMGFGSAVPYTALAQKAMSRHFRCLKDAIAAQLRHSCEVLGEKDAAGNSGITKGETPRLKMLEQSLRQQRTFHQMGMMEQEAWRPQRGLPERSVNILRAWLFEHFLHPYPSDADKHLLARQTGLSRSQVSNWFINARVRLWKPMVEEMYQQEAKDHEQEEVIIGQEREMSNHNNIAQTPTPSTTTTTTTTTTTATTATAAPASAAAATTTTTTTTGNKRSQINDSENDPSLIAINTQCFSESHAKQQHSGNSNTNEVVAVAAVAQQQPPPIPISGSSFPVTHIVVDDYGTTSGGGHDHMGSTLIRFGTTTTGDVSLTLGLRHAGNMPDNSQASFSLRDFGGC